MTLDTIYTHKILVTLTLPGPETCIQTNRLFGVAPVFYHLLLTFGGLGKP